MSPGSRKVTLAEVAASAGVSTTTASYILNGRSAQMRISPDTERRVREAVATLGYRPNRNARSLRTAKTSTVGVITDFVASGMFASAMLAGANAAAREADLLLVIGESEGDVAVRDRLIDEMLDRQVDGILYVTRTALQTPLPAKLRGAQTVMLNCFDPEGSAPAVLADERAGGRTAAEVLLRAGIDTDVFVVGEDPEPLAIAGPLRLEGVRERLGEAGADVAGIVPCQWGVETAYVATQDWLAAGHVPRGLICMNDRVAMGAYEALAENGLSVPDAGLGGVVRRFGPRVVAPAPPDVGHPALPGDGGARRGTAARSACAPAGPGWSRCRCWSGTPCAARSAITRA